MLSTPWQHESEFLLRSAGLGIMLVLYNTAFADIPLQDVLEWTDNYLEQIK